MTIKPFDFKLKDGRTATLLSPREQDINGIIEYLKISAGETEFILRYPEECGKYTYEAEKAIIDRMNAAEDEAMMICIVDGKVETAEYTSVQILKPDTVQALQLHCARNTGILELAHACSKRWKNLL